MTDSAARFEFCPLSRADFPQLLTWLRHPHVAEWWPSAQTAAAVEEEFAELLDTGSTTRAYLVRLDGRAIGYIQSYVVMGSGDGWWEDETDPGARGIDQFIGEPTLLGRGIGTAMVRAFVATLFADAAVTQIQTDPDPHNARAIRCYEKAGFHAVTEVVTPDGAALLMIHPRPARTG
ncbi:MAG: GNAT family N-acetyltransferase [Gemmatimonadota bacterium]